MCKKVGILVLGLIVAFGFLRFTRMGSYTCTALKQLRIDAEKHVSVEFEIKRLKNEVANLDPDINKNRSIVAEQIVGVEKLREEVDGSKKKLAQQKEQIGRVVAELKSGATSIVYNNREQPADRVREQLDKDVDHARSFEKALKSKERLLEARERMMENNKKKLQAMIDAKSELQTQIAQLEADYQEVQLRATESRVQFDDSRLADIKQSLDKLRDRVKIEKVTQDLVGDLAAPTAEKSKTSSEVVRKAEQFLNGDTEETKVADQK
jgi:hypothetical protein